MKSRQIIVIGGGPAGIFAAIACAGASPGAGITVLESGPEFLAKVRISGGGRCNVTHACFEPRELAERYPRGGRALIGPFKRFQPRDTVAWFESRGVQLKTEGDGRVFPVSDDSRTIVDCLLRAAKTAGVKLFARRGVERVTRRATGGFDLSLTGGDTLFCDRLLLAIGGCRTAAAENLAIVTTDNPRRENPMEIIAEISRGFSGTGKRCVQIPDRREAIAAALAEAREGDIVVVAGKGHERTQEFESTVVPFSDRDVITELTSDA